MRSRFWLQKLAIQCQMLFSRRRAAERLQDELHFHLEQKIAENQAAGMTARQARQAALREFGNPGLVREQTRATWSWSWLEQLSHDLRYGVRTLARSPGFASIAILVMALGIGANVAMFTVVRAVLLNPLPYRDPSRLFTIYSHNAITTKGSAFAPIDAGSFFAWQQAAKDIAQMALISPFQSYNVSAEGGQLPEKADAAMCSANFFSTLGVSPSLGRSFTGSDDTPEAEATVILSDSFWKRRYNSDPGVVGRKLWLDAKPYTVIGVMPASLVFLGPFSSGKIQLWTPVSHEAPRWLMTTFEDHEFVAIARLMPGVTLSGLLSRLDVVQRHLKAEHPAAAVRQATSGRSMLDDAVEDYKTPLYVLFAATGCVLLIAALNVASLLVARAAARRKETAVRTALGGSRLRLIRERVLESLLLTAAGGALGIGMAAAALRWLEAARPDIHRTAGMHLDWMAFCFTVATVALCAIFSGLISALSVDGRKILAALQDSSRGAGNGRARAGLRRGLLVVEVSLTVVLLVGAGLLLKSYNRLKSTDLGVPTANVLTMGVSLPDARYKTPVDQVAFFEQLIARVRALPGVESAGLVSTAPGEGWGGDRLSSVVEHPPQEKGAKLDLMVRGADPGYFAAIHLPILRGRTFSESERLTHDHVGLISLAAAKAFFPNEDPIGKHLQYEFGGDIFEVIGIVGDTRYSVSEPPIPMIYEPIYGNSYGFATIVIRARSTLDVETLAMPIEKVIGQMDRDLPVSDVMTLEQSIGKSTLGSQFDSLLVLVFAVIALTLAAAGLYGVLAYLVTQRTSEIGIRIALGAQRTEVLRLMFFDGLRPALAGLVLGLGAGAAVAKLIKSLLYGAEPYDPVVFAAVSLALLLVAGLACILPAWRASRLNPMQALRTE
jgi:putative ABC transport system permease protein